LQCQIETEASHAGGQLARDRFVQLTKKSERRVVFCNPFFFDIFRNCLCLKKLIIKEKINLIFSIQLIFIFAPKKKSQHIWGQDSVRFDNNDIKNKN
jgi:hypothetical protein